MPSVTRRGNILLWPSVSQQLRNLTRINRIGFCAANIAILEGLRLQRVESILHLLGYKQR